MQTLDESWGKWGREKEKLTGKTFGAVAQGGGGGEGGG